MFPDVSCHKPNYVAAASPKSTHHLQNYDHIHKGRTPDLSYLVELYEIKYKAFTCSEILKQFFVMRSSAVNSTLTQSSINLSLNFAIEHCPT